MTERVKYKDPVYLRMPRLAEGERVKSLSRVRLFETLWTVAYQAPPSRGFSRQEYWSVLPFPSPGDLHWSWLPFPSPGDLPDQGSNPGLLHCTQILYRVSTRKVLKSDTPPKKISETDKSADRFNMRPLGRPSWLVRDPQPPV